MTAQSPITIGSSISAFVAAVTRGVIGSTYAVMQLPSLIKAVVRAWRNRRPVMQMLELDDRMLRDIGLTRGDVTSALASPMATDPSSRLRVMAVERRAGNRAQAYERLAAAKPERPVVKLAQPQLD